jgi:hypothetical protein
VKEVRRMLWAAKECAGAEFGDARLTHGVHGVLLEAEDGRWDRLPPNDRRPDAVHPWEIVREAAQRTTSP